MATVEVSLQRVAEAVRHVLAGHADESIVSESLNFEVNDLRLHADPVEADLPVEPLRCTFRYWDGLPKTAGVADVMKIDPDALRDALGYLMLIDVEPGEDAYRYALYGSKIAAVAGFDMTGKTVWQIATTSVIQTFFAACYRAVREARRTLYTAHKAPPQITASHWHRLILPLGKGGEVKRFLVCNTPLQNGRPV
jgi:hypothetical protein